MIDPYYRTLRGLVILIEKDWCQFGHQFALRNSVCMSNDKQRSPVFVQFLDCLHQIAYQYPSAFEFNLELLRVLAFHSYSGVFGTFLCDNRKEREKAQLKDKTVSVWSYIFDQEERFINPFYSYNQEVLRLNTMPSSMRFWREYFFQHSPTKSVYFQVPVKDTALEFYKSVALKALQGRKIRDVLKQ
jgi:hypothetical protein